MDWFLENFSNILEALAYIVSAATVITAMTATNDDDEIVNSVKKVLNFLAGNFGKNKNADDNS